MNIIHEERQKAARQAGRRTYATRDWRMTRFDSIRFGAKRQQRTTIAIPDHSCCLLRLEGVGHRTLLLLLLHREHPLGLPGLLGILLQQQQQRSLNSDSRQRSVVLTASRDPPAAGQQR